MQQVIRKTVFILFTCSVVILGCDGNRSKNYNYTTGHVDSTQHIHWGKGYYKLKVYYTFQRGDTVLNGIYVHKMEKAYTAKYEQGDSVLVRYNSVDYKESEIIKITDKKRKIKL